MKLWEMREAMQKWVDGTALLDQNLDVVTGRMGQGFEEAKAPVWYPIDVDGIEVEYTNDIHAIVLN